MIWWDNVMCTQNLPDWLIRSEIHDKEMVVVVLDQFHRGISLGAILIKLTVNGVIVKFHCVVSQLTFEHAMFKRTFFIIQNWLNIGTLSERWILPGQFLDHYWDFSSLKCLKKNGIRFRKLYFKRSVHSTSNRSISSFCGTIIAESFPVDWLWIHVSRQNEVSCQWKSLLNYLIF